MALWDNLGNFVSGLGKPIMTGYMAGKHGMPSALGLMEQQRQTQRQEQMDDYNMLANLYKTTTDPEIRKEIGTRILNLPQVKKLKLSIQNLGQPSTFDPSTLDPNKNKVSYSYDPETGDYKYNISPYSPTDIVTSKVMERILGSQQSSLGVQSTGTAPQALSQMGYDYGTQKLATGRGPISEERAGEMGIQAPVPPQPPQPPQTPVGLPEIPGYNVGIRAGPLTLTKTEPKQFSPTERQQLTSLEAVKKTSERVKKGFNPDYVGWWKEISAQYRGSIPGQMTSGEAAWRADLASLIEYMYAISGRQLSDAERMAVKQMMPRGEMTKENFSAVLDNFITRLGDRLDISKESLKQAGFNILGESSQPTKSNQPTLEEIEAELKRRGTIK